MGAGELHARRGVYLCFALCVRVPWSVAADVGAALLSVDIASVASGLPAAGILDGEDAAFAAGRHATAQDTFDAEVVLAIAKLLAEALQDADYTPPKSLFLKTGGAYSRRIDESMKDRRFLDAVADALRGMMRPGIDSTAADLFMGKLAAALLRMERIREMELQEQAEEDSKYAKQKEEATALGKEWSAQLTEDEALWSRFVDQWRPAQTATSDARTSGDEARQEIASVELQVASNKENSIAKLSVFDGEDASHATVQFCAAQGIRSVDEVTKLVPMLNQKLAATSYVAPDALRLDTAGSYLERGLAHEQQFDLGKAGADYARGLHSPGMSDEQRQHLTESLDRVLQMLNVSVAFSDAWLAQDCATAVASALQIASDQRPEMVQLVVARCHMRMGKKKEAIAAITGLLTRCDKSGTWQDEEPRVVASVLGASLALRVGDIDKAKKMYQIVLRADPEQRLIKLRYKVLKTYMRILSDIEQLLERAQNHDALRAVLRSQMVLETVMGKDGAAAASTRLLLFECKARSGMAAHDEAIEACNTAIQQFENHDNPDPMRIAEGYAIRADANMKDNSFDDAVADLNEALKKVPNSHDYKERLEEARRKQSEWNKSEEERDRRGKVLGHFPKKRPMRQLLDLPDNIDELEQEEKCKRLKKAFHKMSLRWHPDKAKGGKKRAQRKSSEISEAKSYLELVFGCKRRR